MGIEDDDSDSQFLELEDNNWSKFVYNNSEDKAEFNPDASADNGKNENKIKSRSHLDLKVKDIDTQPTSQCQV